MKAWNQTCLPLVATWLCGCGDSAEDLGSVALPVCGEGGTGFVAQERPVRPITALDSELGTRYAVISPSCRFAVSDTREHRGAAVEGTLTAQQAEDLSTFLALDRRRCSR